MKEAEELNRLFEQARGAKSDIPFEAAQDRFLQQSLSASARPWWRSNGLMGSVVAILLVVTGGLTMLWFSSEIPPSIPAEATKDVGGSVAVEEEKEGRSTSALGQLKMDVPAIEVLKAMPALMFSEPNTSHLPRRLEATTAPVLIRERHFNDEVTTPAVPSIVADTLDSNYRFPNLTKEERKANIKMKARMMKALAKKDKKHYALIPGGVLEQDGQRVKVQSNYAKINEVTNLEYRTFLFDLLIQDRKQEFLKAKPKQNVWSEDYPSGFLESMDQLYFSHPAYDHYPVVGISRQGALMFCYWLTNETNKAYLGKLKQPIPSLKLPSDSEWIWAAQGGDKALKYPWPVNSLTTVEGCYLANHSCCDSASLTSFARNSMNEDGAWLTITTGSYAPNPFGLYNLAGNVAEMVWYLDDMNRPGTKGGSWSSSPEELLIRGPERFKGIFAPSSNIGFRPFFNAIGQDKGLRPPGTVFIREGFYMDATEISNINWSEYQYWLKKQHGANSSEYKASLLDTLVWQKAPTVPYGNYYHTHSAYNDYPVVGVSYQQATAFCQWRSDRVNEYFDKLSEKDGKFRPSVSYRLPTREEWEMAAKAGYPGLDKRRAAEKPKFNLKASVNPSNNNTFYTGGGNEPAPVSTFPVNQYHLRNIIGNVAEMIHEEGIAKGGSWQHLLEEVGWEQDYPYSAPQCWLGFRCVCEVESDF